MPRIGTDEWVSQIEGRVERYGGRAGSLLRTWDRTTQRQRFVLFLAVAAAFPFLTGSDYHVRVGINVLLLAMLALGLNIVVGWAGLLDLGYIAFYGFGAYGYAWVSSGHFDLHWPTEATIAAVVLASALLGLLLGLPSRRLIGDYLAIMTLFFAQIFFELMVNLDRIDLPWSDRTLNLTGGPNGIPGVDGMTIFGVDLTGFQDYYFFLLILLSLAVIGLHRLNRSRTGRAFRAVREDPLAAELMTMPVNWLKLLAFSMGAAMAGLTGTVFAAVQVGTFPQNFQVMLLITIYAALILGGSGSIPGAIVGAVVVASVPEILRTPDAARWLFYVGLGVSLAYCIRPWRRLAAVVAGTVAFGFAVHAIVGAAWAAGTGGQPAKGGVIASGIDGWVVLPAESRTMVGNFGFVALIAAILALVLLRGWHRAALLVPALYLAAFVWENRLVFEPSVTRQLLFGAVLVVMMAARPHGLLGTPRVEIV
jgi:branched-chain amino acid transport system permease protein